MTKATINQINRTLKTLKKIPTGYNKNIDFNTLLIDNMNIHCRNPSDGSWWRYYEIVTLIADEDINNALDIGCGWGTIYNILRELGYNINAIDIDNPSNIEHTSFQYHDIDKSPQVPYDDCTFDLVICSEVIEHIEEPIRLLKEIYRILSPNGIVIITFPNILNFTSRYNYLMNRRHSKFQWTKNDECIYHPKNGIGGHISAIDYFKINYLSNKIGLNIEAIKTNYYRYPKNLIKRLLFIILRTLINTFRMRTDNINLELGDTLIIKMRKIKK